MNSVRLIWCGWRVSSVWAAQIVLFIRTKHIQRGFFSLCLLNRTCCYTFPATKCSSHRRSIVYAVVVHKQFTQNFSTGNAIFRIFFLSSSSQSVFLLVDVTLSAFVAAKQQRAIHRFVLKFSILFSFRCLCDMCAIVAYSTDSHWKEYNKKESATTAKNKAKVLHVQTYRIREQDFPIFASVYELGCLLAPLMPSQVRHH